MRGGVASLAVLQMLVMAVAAGAPTAAAPIAQAFTTNRLYRVVLLTAPRPLPLQRHFDLELAVYEGKPHGRRVTHAKLDLTAGMTHGESDFVHGMLSTPVIEAHGDRYAVHGMLFHMQGTWTVRIRVRKGGHVGSADLNLECCGDE